MRSMSEGILSTRPGSLVSMLPRLKRRDSRGGRRVLDRDREADADEHALLGGIQDRGDDADDRPVEGHERSARAARVGGGVELDEIRQQALPLGGAELALQAG